MNLVRIPLAILRPSKWAVITGDRGASLVEVMVATFLFAVAVMGVVGTMGSGLSLVGNSRQRSAAVAVAQERLERVHTIPYGHLALYCGCQGVTQPTHSTDATNPDNAITTDNTKYVVDSTHTENAAAATSSTFDGYRR